MAGLVAATHAKRLRFLAKVGEAPQLLPVPSTATAAAPAYPAQSAGNPKIARALPTIAPPIGVDGRDKPGHDAVGDSGDVCMP